MRVSQLASAIALVLSASSVGQVAYAMESISDQSMSEVTGADGVAINVQATQVTFNNLYFQDNIDNSGNTRQLLLNTVALKNNVSANPIVASAKIGVGSTGTTPALSLNLNLSPLMLTASQIEICANSTTCSNPTPVLGALAVQLPNATQASFTTTNGFLNSAGTASVTLLLDGANIFFTSNGNQVVTSDIRANINANGKIWVDAVDGFRFSGSVALPAASDSRAGIQASVLLQNGTTNALAASPNGVIRFGVSGNMPSLNLYLRGTKATASEDNLGSVVGASGVAARLVSTIQSGTTLSHDGSNTGSGFELELGAAGAGGYGIRMSNFVPFSNVTKTNPTIDSGNIYLDLINTTSLIMPVPLALSNGKGANNIASSVSNFGLSATDTQTIAGTDSLLLAVRGLSIQGVSLNTTFYQNGTGAVTGGVTGFALMPVLYGVSGNITLNANTATALGYSLALAMSGNNVGTTTGTTETGTTPSTDIQESAIFLADTSTPSKAQYVGLRDLNVYFKSNGTITLNGNSTSNNINITLPNFLLAMSANFAAGYLPGAEPVGFQPFISATNKDTIETINLKLESDATYNSTNFVNVSTSAATPSTLGLTADLTLKGSAGTTATPAAPNQAIATSFFRIAEPSGAALGLDNITGRLALASGSKLVVASDSGTLTTLLQINPQNIKGNELLATLNLYTSGGTASSIGKMVVTGGTLNSTLTLKPVSIP